VFHGNSTGFDLRRFDGRRCGLCAGGYHLHPKAAAVLRQWKTDRAAILYPGEPVFATGGAAGSGFPRVVDALGPKGRRHWRGAPDTNRLFN
jgi:hypothetical protein